MTFFWIATTVASVGWFLVAVAIAVTSLMLSSDSEEEK